MIDFELSNKVKIPAMGIGTFLLTPDQAERSRRRFRAATASSTQRTPTSTSAPSAAR